MHAACLNRPAVDVCGKMYERAVAPTAGTADKHFAAEILKWHKMK
jgi:hypothetical protein